MDALRIDPKMPKKSRRVSTTTRERNLQFRGQSPLDLFLWIFSTGHLFLCVFFFSVSRFTQQFVVRQSPQNVENIARFAGGEKKVQDPVTSLAVMVFSVRKMLTWDPGVIGAKLPGLAS